MEDYICWELKFQSCHYSERLLGRVLELNAKSKNKANIQEIKKAIYYAKKYHAQQLRDSGEPYYSHPIEVAYMAADYIFDTNSLVTSILHDTIEDTAMNGPMIESLFGSLIANQVRDLTRYRDGRKISLAEVIQPLWQQKKYNLLLIKMLDRIHNMRTISAKSPEKQKETAIETLTNFITLAIYLGAPKLEHELSQICSNIMQKDELKISSFQLLPPDNIAQLLFQALQNDLSQPYILGT